MPRFTSRFYKSEVNLTERQELGHWLGHRPIVELDERFWRKYMKTLAAAHFNGFVMYPTHAFHPFPQFLDYNEWPEAVGWSATEKKRRSEALAALRRICRIAREYDIRTFIQHYVSHFPKSLSDHHAIYKKGGTDRTSLANLNHPVVFEYSRYVYRRTFELLPDQSGLYVNFESAANAAEFVDEVMYDVFGTMDRKPDIVFRLWNFNALPLMKDLVEKYEGKVILAHKVMDRNDVYYHPKADPRALEWKKALPDTEFMYLVGPCHNCATIQSQLLWADTGFVHELMSDIEKKKIDSFAFHTVMENLSVDIDINQYVTRDEMLRTLFNKEHLDATVEYVRGKPHNPAAVAKRYSDRLGIPRSDARRLVRLMETSSSITMMMTQQFFWSSSFESFLHSAFTRFYQDPFFYPHMAWVNRASTLPYSLEPSWLNPSMKRKNLPEWTEPVLDAVNPEITEHPSRNPKWMMKSQLSSG